MNEIVIGLIGGSGGVGASTCAAALAKAAGGLLIDLDPVGAGLDILLGVEQDAGARWSGVRVGGGFLDPELLRAGLPRWADIPVLALDAGPPSSGDAVQVITAAAVSSTVVVDLGRGAGALPSAVLGVCDLVLILARAELAEVAAAYAVARSLRSDVDPAESAAVGLLVLPGPVGIARAARAIGAPLVASWPRVRRPLSSVDNGPARLHRALRRAADDVVDGITVSVHHGGPASEAVLA